MGITVPCRRTHIILIVVISKLRFPKTSTKMSRFYPLLLTGGFYLTICAIWFRIAVQNSPLYTPSLAPSAANKVGCMQYGDTKVVAKKRLGLNRGVNVAVVGSGASGASFPYFLSQKLMEQDFKKLNIDVYESEAFVGGRARTAVFTDSSGHTEKIEIGAGVFVAANRLLARAAEELHEEPFVADTLAASSRIGFWDGEKPQFTFDSDSFLSVLALVRRYGLGSTQLETLVRQCAEDFFNVYDDQLFDTPADFVDRANLRGYINVSLATYLTKQGVSQLYINEFVGGLTRAIYMQSPQDIHALAGMVALITLFYPPLKIKGGNARVMSSMLNHSLGAAGHGRLHLSHKVVTIRSEAARSIGGESRQIYTLEVLTPEGMVAARHYDAVVLAAPLATSRIHFEGFSTDASVLPQNANRRNSNTNELLNSDTAADSAVFGNTSNQYDRTRSSKRDFVTMHVTLVEGVLNSSFFGYPSWNDVPEVLLTPATPSVPTNAAAAQGHPTVPFSCCQLQRRVDNNTGVSVYKLFSFDAVSDMDLRTMFDIVNIRGVLRHKWEGSYPLLKPIVSSSSSSAEAKDTELLPPFQLSPLLYYTNAFESVFSTMETQMIAARNVADLFLADMTTKNY